MNTYKSFAATVTGISHSKTGKECQDYSDRHDDKAMSVAVVADGHGDESCFRSAKGAEFAVKCASDSIREFIKKISPGPLDFIQGNRQLSRKDFEKLLHDLVNHIIAEWHKKVSDDYTANPFSEAELAPLKDKYKKRYVNSETDGKIEYRHHAYGTTLIAAAITEDYWFGLHIGDGRLTALYADGTSDQPVPWDDRCYLNVTTSVCDEDAGEAARIYYAPKSEKPLPVAVFLCSDGIDDNYPVDENEKHLFRLYRTIALTFAEDGFESSSAQVKDLAHSFATNGKGDDTSISGIIDMEALKDLVPVYRKQIAEETSEAEKAKTEKEITVEKAVAKNTNKSIAIDKAPAAIAAREKQKNTVEPHEYGTYSTSENTRNRK
jgi:serine/threonine protein phosphatase PrpC